MKKRNAVPFIVKIDSNFILLVFDSFVYFVDLNLNDTNIKIW